jgi:hypothetical protein
MNTDFTGRFSRAARLARRQAEMGLIARLETVMQAEKHKASLLQALKLAVAIDPGLRSNATIMQAIASAEEVAS